MTVRIDVVTICFAEELKMLQMQARSIRRHMEQGLLGSYRIIINDVERSEECVQFIEQVIKPELGWVASRVKLSLGNTIDPSLRGSGWLTQQVLKLAVARLVSTDHYLVLDAKNHFIAPVSRATLFRESIPRARLAVPTRNQRKWLDASLAYFELGREHGTGQVGVTVTPYLMITAVCLSLLTEVERRGDRLTDLFSRPEPRPSEFFLYYSYMQAFHGGYQSSYCCDMLAQATLFTKHPKTDAAFEAIMERTFHPDCWTFAVHRNRLSRLAPPKMKRVVAVWKEAQLIEESEEDWFTTLYRREDMHGLTSPSPPSLLHRVATAWKRWMRMPTPL